MKDLRGASYILEIKIYRDKSKMMLGLSQKMYIEEVLKKFSIKNSKRRLLPFRHEIHLFKKMYSNISKEIQCMSKIPYTSAIGSLMYVMLYIQPDIAHAVSVTSKYQLNSDKEY